MINAFKRIANDNLRLLIVGDGPDKERAVSLVNTLNLSEQVIFTGKLSFIDILCAYSISDLYVLPSYFEGMPTTVMEALVLGCPVIATDIPGVGDNFRDVAELVPPHDVQQLAASITNLLLKESVVYSEILREKYDVKNVFEKYSKIYV